MTTSSMRNVARNMQRVAAAHPLAYADLDPVCRPGDRRFFVQVDRELTWGLTLNK